MMKSKLITAALFAFATCAVPASFADTVAGTPDATVHYESSPVGEAVAALHLLNEVHPNVTARYYIYLRSAGWCGPCNKEMPQVVEAYKDIKKSGQVELILVDFDYTPAEAEAFIARYGVLFPAVMSEHALQLPGYQGPRSIPSVIIVDEQGNVVTSGHASLIQDWRAYTIDR